MELSISEYSEALEEFLVKMEAIPSHEHPDIQVALDKLCRLLRVDYVEAILYNNFEEENNDKGKKACSYVGRQPVDRQRCRRLRKVTGEGNVVVYLAYQSEGDENWTEEELSKIDIMLLMIFVFNGRIRVMNMAEYLVFHDKDSGLPNTAYFIRHLGTVINKGIIGEYGACFFNLRRFSVINRQIGRQNGDVVMRMFVTRLDSMLGENEVVCRVGGDNYVVLFHRDNLNHVMKYLQGAEIVYDKKDNKSVWVTASAGYYMIPGDCTKATNIMDCVSMANQVVKNVTKAPYVFYNDELTQRMKHVKELESVFPQALENEEFKVYYQPKIYVDNYGLAGAEALCRWCRDGEIVPPMDFIPALEQSREICRLDYYMLEHVCMDIRRWLDEGRNVVKVSVNFSRCNLTDLDLLDKIVGIVDKYNVPHEYIEIELTETTTDVNFEDLKHIVIGLQNKGISTAVDDFGMGYSSLNLIRELPWNVLKIDKCFLDEAEDDPKKNANMLKHIISMASDLGMECVVEGVETEENLELIRENKCNIVQGYYFDRPLPKEEFEKRITN